MLGKVCKAYMVPLIKGSLNRIRIIHNKKSLRRPLIRVNHRLSGPPTDSTIKANQSGSLNIPAACVPSYSIYYTTYSSLLIFSPTLTKLSSVVSISVHSNTVPPKQRYLSMLSESSIILGGHQTASKKNTRKQSRCHLNLVVLPKQQQQHITQQVLPLITAKHF